MKEKIQSISFIFLLFFFFLLGLILKDKEISSFERRNLTTLASVKKDPLLNLEKYLDDQFPFRNTFLSFYSFFDRVVFGKKENNNVYIKEDVLIEKNYPLHEKKVLEFSEKINKIANEFSNSQVFYSVIPDKSYFLEEKNYQKLDFLQLFTTLEKQVSIPYIHVLPLLQLEDYYKTDIHIKQESYQKIVQELATHFLFDIQDMAWQKQSYKVFLGATYAKGGFFSKPEELFYYTNSWTDKAEVYHLEFGEKEVYDKEKLGGTDSYSVFLSGPSSFIEISSPNAFYEKEIILFRDSFGSSLAPLLIPYYKKITLIDLRYINWEMAKKYINFEKQDVLFLYSTLLINESNLLKVKGK